MNTKIDKSNMFQSIWDFPENIIDAVKLSESISLDNIYGGVNKIIIAGMGGSAIGGDVVNSLKNLEIDEKNELYGFFKMIQERSY